MPQKPKLIHLKTPINVLVSFKGTVSFNLNPFIRVRKNILEVEPES